MKMHLVGSCLGALLLPFVLAGCSDGASQGLPAMPVPADSPRGTALDVATNEPIPAASTSPAPAGTPINGVTRIESPLSDGTCNPDAVISVSRSMAPGMRDLIASNPASNLHAGPYVIRDADSAVALAADVAASDTDAEEVGWNRETYPSPRAAAVLTSYGAAIAATGAEIPREGEAVNPDRCVWMVTVQRPYIQRRVPHGATPKVFDWYTLVIDQASGEGLDLIAGPGAPDMVSGWLNNP